MRYRTRRTLGMPPVRSQAPMRWSDREAQILAQRHEENEIQRIYAYSHILTHTLTIEFVSTLHSLPWKMAHKVADIQHSLSYRQRFLSEGHDSTHVLCYLRMLFYFLFVVPCGTGVVDGRLYWLDELDGKPPHTSSCVRYVYIKYILRFFLTFNVLSTNSNFKYGGDA